MIWQSLSRCMNKSYRCLNIIINIRFSWSYCCFFRLCCSCWSYCCSFRLCCSYWSYCCSFRLCYCYLICYILIIICWFSNILANIICFVSYNNPAFIFLLSNFCCNCCFSGFLCFYFSFFRNCCYFFL